MRRRIAVSAVVLLTVLAAAAAALAAGPGDLDGNFSGDGKVLTNATSGYDYALGLALQSDGKIVTAGVASGSGGRFSLVRYASDGTRDASFGTNGRVFTNFTGGFDAGYDVALQSDGKIVVAGGVGGSGGRVGLARYSAADGSLDTTFSGDGKIIKNLSSGNDYLYNVTVQSDDKIVAVGHAGGSGGRFAVLRFNSDGTPDTTFGGGDGIVLTNFSRGYDYADDVAIDPTTQSIVVVGVAGGGKAATFAVARYLSDGTLDSTFSGDGKLRQNFTSLYDGAYGVLVQSDGKILVAGPAGKNWALVRYETDGTADPTFGPSGNGRVMASFTKGYDSPDEIAMDASGIVVAGGAGVLGGNPKFAVARYTLNGILDTSFSNDGKVVTDFTQGYDYGVDVQLTPGTGEVVVGGIAADGGKSAVARYIG